MDVVWFTVSRNTVDKEEVTGATLEDRLLVLREHARRGARRGVAALNRGLFSDMADCLRAALVKPDSDLWFIVGYDKLQQIFHPRYYTDREAALQRLFATAGLLVACRGAATDGDIGTFLAQGENAPYRDRVRPLPLERRYRSLAATDIRSRLAHGAAIAHGAQEELPRASRRFVSHTAAYAPPRTLPGGERVDVYALRGALVDMLAQAEPDLPPSLDVCALVELAGADSETARTLRAAVAANDVEVVLQIARGAGRS